MYSLKWTQIEQVIYFCQRDSYFHLCSGSWCYNFKAPVVTIAFDSSVTPAANTTYDTCYKINKAAYDLRNVTVTASPYDYNGPKTMAVNWACDNPDDMYHSVYTTNPWWQVVFSSHTKISMVTIVIDLLHAHYSSAIEVRVNSVPGNGTFAGELLTKVSGTYGSGGEIVYQPTTPVMGLSVSVQYGGLGTYALSFCEVVIE